MAGRAVAPQYDGAAPGVFEQPASARTTPDNIAASPFAAKGHVDGISGPAAARPHVDGSPLVDGVTGARPDLRVSSHMLTGLAVQPSIGALAQVAPPRPMAAGFMAPARPGALPHGALPASFAAGGWDPFAAGAAAAAYGYPPHMGLSSPMFFSQLPQAARPTGVVMYAAPSGQPMQTAQAAPAPRGAAPQPLGIVPASQPALLPPPLTPLATGRQPMMTPVCTVASSAAPAPTKLATPPALMRTRSVPTRLSSDANSPGSSIPGGDAVLRMPRIDFRHYITVSRATGTLTAAQIENLKVMRRRVLSRDYSQRSRANKKQTMLQLEASVLQYNDVEKIFVDIRRAADATIKDSVPPDVYDQFLQQLTAISSSYTTRAGAQQMDGEVDDEDDEDDD